MAACFKNSNCDEHIVQHFLSTRQRLIIILTQTRFGKLILTGHREGMWDIGKLHITYQANMNKWTSEQGLGEIRQRQNILRTTRDRKFRRAMINIRPGGTVNIEK